MRTIEQMISAEVLCCLSSLVSTLAQNMGAVEFSEASRDLGDLTTQAFELASPIDDWEEAAIQDGWSHSETSWRVWHKGDQVSAGYQGYATPAEVCAALCRDHDIEPYQREVFEHWAVTDWFADKLEAAGEKVDRDFAGLCIWARTTTGQAIYADAVIERIYAETHTGSEG